MSDYTKTTDFLAKDSLAVGNANKIIKGSEFETEFDAIAVAVNSKTEVAAVIGAEHTWTAQQIPMNSDLTFGTTVNWDCDVSGQVVAIPAVNSNFTLANPTNVNLRGAYILIISQGATPYSITWGTAYQFPGGVKPSLTPTAYAVDIFSFLGGGSGNMRCVGIVKDSK